jgi:hypothetical protein
MVASADVACGLTMVKWKLVKWRYCNWSNGDTATGQMAILRRRQFGPQSDFGARKWSEIDDQSEMVKQGRTKE